MEIGQNLKQQIADIQEPSVIRSDQFSLNGKIVNQNNEFRKLIDLECEKSISPRANHARTFFTACRGIKHSREEYRKKLSSKIERLRLASLLSGLVTIVAVGSSMFLHHVSLNTPNINSLILLSLVLSFLFFCFLDTKIKAFEQELSYFKPLKSEPKNCLELKEIISRAPTAAIYIKSVVASYEELTVGDFEVAGVLERGSEEKQKIDALTQACFELHALVS